MTTTELATTTGGTLALDDAGWSEDQVAALVQLGVEHASKADLSVYHHVCLRTGLDPFARQIYMIRRDGRQVIQTGIDGLRLVARRAVDKSRERFNIGSPEWCGADGRWTDVWLEEGPPAAARVTVYRNGEPFPALALWREYVQYKNAGGITRMWSTRPAGQLAKCAEALALRKAFPQDLSGLYTDDEIASDVAGGGEPREERSTLRDVLAQDDTVPGEVVTKIEQLQADVDDAATIPEGGDPKGRTAAREVGDKLEEQRQDRHDNPDRQPLDSRGTLGRRMWGVIRDAGIPDKGSREFVSKVLGREITKSADLTNADARTVIAHVAAMVEPESSQS